MSKAEASTQRGFRNLLLLLLLYLFVSPMLAPYPSLEIITHTLLSMTLFISVYAIQKRQNYRSYAMILLVPVLGIYWLGLYSFIPFDLLSVYILLALFFLLLIIAFAGQLLRAQDISLQIIFGTLCLYLIIGLFWGSLYCLLYELDPGSFSGVLLNDPQASLLTTFNYFSIVTLTTLGYGDITPQTHAAASLCQIEAITGQFYITVLVAWLVGTHVAKKMEKKQDRN